MNHSCNVHRLSTRRYVSAGGVVYYANYLKFMERARSEWLRASGFEQDALRDEAGVVFVVRRVEIDYLSPARFNDRLEVSVGLRETGRASLGVRQELMRGSTCLARAEVKLACVDAVHFKPVKMPATILQTLRPTT
ncbi:MAG: tol-pal system-associated acyl-CoA thioesterase [Thiobacillus sp.]|nr:tol-pal system-associated acyl-CoA thioesterase [Thiobacillus sp.]